MNCLQERELWSIPLHHIMVAVINDHVHPSFTTTSLLHPPTYLMSLPETTSLAGKLLFLPHLLTLFPSWCYPMLERCSFIICWWTITSELWCWLLRFTQFCDKHHIHKNLCMPASKALLCFFVTNQGAGIVSKGTVTSWLSGLEMWHNGAPWHGGHILKCTKHGVTKLTPPSSHKPPCDPVFLQHMVALHQHLNLSNTQDCPIWAAACTAWWGITQYVP